MGIESLLSAEPPSLSKFLDNVERSQLLSNERVREIRVRAEQPGADPLQLAAYMVRFGWMSLWQSEQLLGGRRSFFLGQYLLLDRLGGGTMGPLYKAQKKGLGKLMAVRALPAERLRDPQTIARLRDHLDASSRLYHANICQMQPLEALGPVMVVSSEYLEGKSLQRWQHDIGRLPIATACACVRQAALGLSLFEQHEIVHGDIRLETLFVASPPQTEPAVKILDAGLARFFWEEDAAHGATRAVLAAKAPEVRAEPTKLDIRGDIYGLGYALYQLLTGEAPPDDSASVSALLGKILSSSSNNVPSVRKLRPEVPEEVDAAVIKMLARDPNERYASPRDVAVALFPYAVASLSRSDVPKRSDSSEKLLPGKRSSGERSAMSVLAASKDRDPVRSSDEIRLSIKPEHDRQLDGILTEIEEAGAVDRRLRLRNVRRFSSTLLLLLLLAVGLWTYVRLGRTLIIVEWPSNQRVGGSLEVDGHKRALPASGPVRILGSWGQRRLKLTRPGYEPLDLSLVLERGETRNLTPQWKLPPPTPAIAPFSVRKAAEYQERWAGFLNIPVVETNKIGMKLALIPPGEAMLGSSDVELETLLGGDQKQSWWYDEVRSEAPHRPVRISKPYYIGVHEVTVDQFRQFVKATSYRTEAEVDGKGGVASGPGGTLPRSEQTWQHKRFAADGNLPVTQVSWNDATAFCKWLSGEEKKTYRLPTEAEWEFAARAGSAGRWSFGDVEASLDDFAVFAQDAAEPVGRKKANSFGLFDVHGGVSEWCSDWYEKKDAAATAELREDPGGPPFGVSKVLRGGSFLDPPFLVRSARRLWFGPNYRSYLIGFRVVCETP